MELRHLRYFVTVAEELHFARASERLFISQPALSQQIRSLEGELGLKLLDRNRQRVALTPEGRAFMAEARIAVQAADRAAGVARALAEGATGELRLSHLRTAAGGLPQRIVRDYQKRYPGVDIITESGTTAVHVSRLQAGELDAAFVHTPIDGAANLGTVDIGTEAIVVALPDGHELARRRQIHREYLPDVPLVFFPRHITPGFYDTCLSQVYGAAIPDIVRTEPSEERMLMAVAEGAGIGLIVEDRAATLRVPGVTYRRFSKPEPAVGFGLTFREPPSIATLRFIEIAEELGQQVGTPNRPSI